MRRLTFTLLMALLCLAQTPPSQEITLVAGKGELLSFTSDVARVAISEPKIADAVVVSPREVMVNAKSPGRTTLIIWIADKPQRYDITVRPDEEAIHQLRRELQEALHGSEINISWSGDSIVLTGKVKDAEQARRAQSLASARARNVVNLLEAPPAPDPRQILLEVKFASIDRVALAELGFNFFANDLKGVGSGTTQQFQTPRFSQLQFQNFELRSSNVNFADLLNLFVFRPDLNLGATIRALQARNLLQMLAEPNLIAIEGAQASFLAGGEFPFPTIQATTSGGAVAPIITVQFRPFGVRLNFQPTVTASGGIHLKVQPEVSALDFSNAVTLQGFLIPALSTRRAETEVLLKDGESFAIAGLIDNRVVQVLNRIRGLGDIPVLGHLFRSRSTRKSTDELLVVITPRFVRPVAPGEPIRLPDYLEPFLPSVSEEKARKKEKSEAPPEPVYVGPKGQLEPK